MLSPALEEQMIRATGGVSFTTAGHPATWAHRDEQDEAVLQGHGRGAEAVRAVATVATGIWPELARDTAVVLDGTTYHVVRGQRIMDGGLTRYLLGVGRG